MNVNESVYKFDSGVFCALVTIRCKILELFRKAEIHILLEDKF